MQMQQEIIKRLQFLAPIKLNLIDESAQHAGHRDNNGGSHFKLEIVSSHFCGKSQIMRHRLIYQSLSDLMPHKLHALSIVAIAEDELR
ncbi:MAG: transcriptional regulator [Betaproteobacteria bacterium HGW-Betaproteobacteria-22]|nr:MAG: transcriptional regulator [Betaproteobacteria bacterium HGW-Betaproteobacteria-22]